MTETTTAPAALSTQQALDLALFAMNTFAEPHASSDEDVAVLDRQTPEALEVLRRLRDRLEVEAAQPEPIRPQPGFGYLVTHEMALGVINAARTQCEALAATFGPSHHYAYGTTTSLMRQTTLMFSTFFGNVCTVTKDGPLNLFVSTSSGFVYGMIFHRRYHDAVLLADDDFAGTVPGTVRGWYCDSCKTFRRHADAADAHDGHHVIPAPVPGEWSFHS